MSKLARLSAEERCRIIEDFVDEVFGDINTDPWLRDWMCHVSMDLPDDPTPDQVDAWVELADLVRDSSFRRRMRAGGDVAAASPSIRRSCSGLRIGPRG